MKLPRRRLLQLAAGAAALRAFSRTALAQTYPTRPVHIIVGFPPGGAADIIARLIGQWLSERFGQSFVIENRTGAASNMAVEAVAKAPSDGYTLLFITAGNAVNATLYDNLNFNFIRDITPVASLVGVPYVMEVHPSLPAKTVPEFIAYAKANPGKINYATAGNGTTFHVYAELFKMMADVDMVAVSYRGNPLPDLLSGQVQVMFAPILSSIDYIRTGKLRALAVTSATRSDVLPDIPTVAEFLSGYEANGWQGLGVPHNTPTEIIDSLNKEINAWLIDSKTKARLADFGSVPTPMTPVEFEKFLVNETKKWAKVVKFAGIKPE